jgi:hypothetical protein
MRKVLRILIAVLLPVFLALFITQFFYTHPILRTVEYCIDAILLVLIGIELFWKKK